uniref:Secreted protein n=1 Tax=Oryza glumipatula TaxID=40148 RepID=A0A0E0B1U0_9ORYZ
MVLLPILGMMWVVVTAAPVSRLVELAMTSMSGRFVASATAMGDALLSELAKIDVVVWMECERMRVGMEQVQTRQCQVLVCVASIARRLWEKEVELDVACRC